MSDIRVRTDVGSAGRGDWVDAAGRSDGAVLTYHEDQIEAVYSQNALSTTKEEIFGDRLTRTRAVVKNIDSTITVTVGDEQVTTSNGMPLKPGESIALHDTGPVWAVAASGTPSVALIDEWRV